MIHSYAVVLIDRAGFFNFTYATLQDQCDISALSWQNDLKFRWKGFNLGIYSNTLSLVKFSPSLFNPISSPQNNTTFLLKLPNLAKFAVRNLHMNIWISSFQIREVLHSKEIKFGYKLNGFTEQMDSSISYKDQTVTLKNRWEG